MEREYAKVVEVGYVRDRVNATMKWMMVGDGESFGSLEGQNENKKKVHTNFLEKSHKRISDVGSMTQPISYQMSA